MLIYIIRRTVDGTLLVTVHPVGHSDKNQMLPHVGIHSPTGPADLALSLLAHHFCESPRQIREEWSGRLSRHSRALELYQHFKHDVLANLKLLAGQHYELTSQMIDEWLRERQTTPASGGPA